MPLDGPDQLHLRAAAGYIELGLFEEADAELDEIDPFCRHLPEVLMARLAIYHGLKKWDLLVLVAKQLTEWNPKEPGFFVELSPATWPRGSRPLDSLKPGIPVAGLRGRIFSGGARGGRLGARRSNHRRPATEATESRLPSSGVAG